MEVAQQDPAFVLPDRFCLDPMVQRGATDTGSKMTPGTMIVEMITTEQQQYLPMTTVLDPNLVPTMPDGNS